MDLFEALGYKHYKGHQDVPDMQLRNLYIDRIYDTFIDEEELQACDHTTTRLQTAWNPVPIHRVNLSGKSGNGYMKDTP